MGTGQSSRLSFSINAQSIGTAVLKPMRLYRTLRDGADPLAAPQKSTGSVTRISELWAYFWGPFLEIGQSWGTLRALQVSTSLLPANLVSWESSVSRPRPPGDPHLACRTQASSVGLHMETLLAGINPDSCLSFKSLFSMCHSECQDYWRPLKFPSQWEEKRNYRYASEATPMVGMEGIERVNSE